MPVYNNISIPYKYELHVHTSECDKIGFVVLKNGTYALIESD